MRKEKCGCRKIFPMAVVLAVLAAAAPCCGLQAGSEKTVVTMIYPGELTEFETLVEEKHPDIDLQVEKNTPTTINGLSERRLRNGQGNDIILTTVPSAQIAEYALDLSAESYVMNYETPIINSYMVDGRVKFIPLPYAMIIVPSSMRSGTGVALLREMASPLTFRYPASTIFDANSTQ